MEGQDCEKRERRKCERDSRVDGKVQLILWTDGVQLDFRTDWKEEQDFRSDGNEQKKFRTGGVELNFLTDGEKELYFLTDGER